MSFQKTVRRAFTQGFVGEIVLEGPLRALPGRIVSDGVAAPNRVSRVFGYAADGSTVGSTTANSVYAANSAEVIVGGANFYGVLFHPKHYALYGTAGDSLAPTLDLAEGSEGEFAQMVSGLAVEIFNHLATPQTLKFNDPVYYITTATDGADNPNALQPGMIVALPEGTAPAATIGRKIGTLNAPLDLPASAPGDIKGAVISIRMTN